MISSEVIYTTNYRAGFGVILQFNNKGLEYGALHMTKCIIHLLSLFNLMSVVTYCHDIPCTFKV